MSAQLYQLAATGFVMPQLVAEMRGVTLIKTTNSTSSSGRSVERPSEPLVLVLVLGSTLISFAMALESF